MAANTGDVIPGQWVVMLKPYATPKLKAAHVNSLTAMTADDSTPFHCEMHHEFELPEAKGYSAKCDLATKDDIERMDEVLSVEPVRLYRHSTVLRQRNAPWGLERISQRRMVQPNSLYEYRYRDDAVGKNTVAYIIDTGINVTHEEFENRATRGPKFVSEPPTPVSDGDIVGHGTHVAGTVAGKTYGVAKEAEIISLKVFFDPPPGAQTGARTDDIIKALEWVAADNATRGKKGVVNLSLGGGFSPALNCVVATVVRSGVLVCVAAGNETQAAENVSPASEPLAVTVGSADKTDKISNFSNYGKLVDIFAPGTDIPSAWVGSNSAQKTISGTSMATPHVVGAACCLLSDAEVLGKTPFEIITQLLILADKNKITGLDRRTTNALLQVNA